jgi:hypothetical protein
LADSGFPCDRAALLGDTMKDTLCICVFRGNSAFKVLLEIDVLNVDLGMVNTLVEEMETWPEPWREYISTHIYTYFIYCTYINIRSSYKKNHMIGTQILFSLYVVHT